MNIREELTLGIDLGIASCGWAVIQTGEKEGRIVAAGVRCFDAPLVDKTGEPRSAKRRTTRGQRRVIRRRSQRMKAVRKLLYVSGLIPNTNDDALAVALKQISPPDCNAQITPWTLRSAAHDRLLTDAELAVVLGHIARHRGFRSNSKREASTNAVDETSKMKKAMEETREGLAKYRSFGDMLANDPRFADRKRNREKDYSHTAKRSDLEDEVRRIFIAQRRFENQRAVEELERDFVDKAFSQRPLQDSEGRVGPCPFEPEQKRTAKRAPSFEMFRFLQRLVNLRIAVGRAERPLTSEEIAVALRKFGERKSYTYKTLRGDLDLDPNARFSGVSRDKESLDIAARKGQSAYGTCTLRETLGDAPWKSLLRTPDKLDRIAEVLTFREAFASIRKGLEEIGLEPLIVDELVTNTEHGAFNEFGGSSGGAVHISALAARNIIVGLRDGLVYSDACARAGYDHTARPAVSLDQIGSPVTRRAFGEAIKQVRAVVREYGPVDFVHIELARDVGKSAEERAKITKGIEERNIEKDKRRQEAADLLERAISDDELLRYELAKEQNFKCTYCDGAIAPLGIAANDMRYQVDHILPWSRFGDDSYLNKALCCVKCNQDKHGRTPFEWFEADKNEEDWARFVARCEGLKEMKGLKKRNFKLRDAAAVEEKFKERNLTDTKWATRLLADELKRMFPTLEGRRRVFARPGAITSKLRRAWGLEGTKKQNGERVPDDRHHAVDALVLAATTESLLQRMTREIQQREKEGRSDDIFHVQQPWPGFRLDVMRAVYGENGSGGVFVSRAERRRARGEGHAATIRQIARRDGETVIFERKNVGSLTEKDLDRIKDPERNAKLIGNIREWIMAGKPKDTWPKSPKGDDVKKISVRTNKKADVLIRGGAADRGEMVRVDVFRKKNRKGAWEYFLVPIYPHQVADKDKWPNPPDRAIQANTDETLWPEMDQSFEFCWTVYPLSMIEFVKSDGEAIEGYSRGVSRSTGAFTVSPHISLQDSRPGIGARTLVGFRKLHVDRLGRRFPIEREIRTWHGAVCT